MAFPFQALTMFLFVFSVPALGQPKALPGRGRGGHTARDRYAHSLPRHGGNTMGRGLTLVRLRIRAPARPVPVAQYNPRSAKHPLSPPARPSTLPEHNDRFSIATKRSSSTEDEITIFFIDHRAPEQVRNYALSRTVLYLPGSPGQVIPVKQIDLPATEQLNRRKGKLFQLPALP